LPYQQLQEQIRCLKEDIERINSLETRRQQDPSIILCNEALKIIEDEQANFHNLGRFQPKLSKLKEYLRGRVEEIRERQLEALQNQATRLEELTDSTKKYELANNLIKQINSQRNQNAETFSSQQQFVQPILNRCIEILRQERETQILDLFQQLPREHRINLYQRLSNYLGNTTEEFDG
jgi:type I site-specific restriction endonuclease